MNVWDVVFLWLVVIISVRKFKLLRRILRFGGKLNFGRKEFISTGVRREKWETAE